MPGLFDDVPMGDEQPAGGLFDDVPMAEIPSGAQASRAQAEDAGGYRYTAAPESTLEYITGLAQKGAQGATFKWADELAAALGAVGGKLPGGHGKSRQQILDDIRAKEQVFTEQNPKAALGAEIGGALASGTAGGAALASRVPALLPQIGGIGRTMLGTGVAAVPAGGITGVGAIEGPAGIGDYATEAGKGAALSGGIGALLGGAGATAARVAGPWINDAARALHDRGIRLTPGEILGGYAKRFEDTMASVPFAGAMVRNRQQEGIESFNRAAWDEALAPIHGQGAGARIPVGTPVGHDAADAGRNVFNRRYGAIVPRLRAQQDNPFITDIMNISRRLPQSVRPQFADAYRRHITENVVNGEITGRGIQDSLQGLRKEAERLQRTPGNAYDHDLAGALGAVRDALEASASRHTSARTMGDFRRLNEAYRNFVTLRQAGSSVAAERGVFSPAQLHAAVKVTDRSVGKGAFARGDAAMQDLSDTGKSVMTRRVSDSGTPERAALMTAILAPSAALKTMIPATALAGLYTRGGNRAFQAAATFSPHTRAAVRRAIQRATELSAPGVGVSAENALEQ